MSGSALGIQALNSNSGSGRSAVRERYGAYAIEHDGGVKGSKIALSGCPEKEAATIGRIEVAEGLPHPMLDGVWGKLSPTAKLSYLISPFGEKSIDEVCRCAAGRTGVRVSSWAVRDLGTLQTQPTRVPGRRRSMSGASTRPRGTASAWAYTR